MDRPRRTAAIQALDKMKEIREWEECTESSALFKTAEKYFEELFANEDKIARVQEVSASDAEATEDECSDADEGGYESSFIDDDEESTADSDEWQPRKRVRFSDGDENDVASDNDDEMESEDDSVVDSSEYSDQGSCVSDEIVSKECEDFADDCLNTSETNMTSLTNNTNVTIIESSNDHLSLDSDDIPTLTRTDFDPPTLTRTAFSFDFVENEL